MKGTNSIRKYSSTFMCLAEADPVGSDSSMIADAECGEIPRRDKNEPRAGLHRKKDSNSNLKLAFVGSNPTVPVQTGTRCCLVPQCRLRATVLHMQQMQPDGTFSN